MLAGEFQALIDYEMLGRDAMLSNPTLDHYLPLLYILGAGFPGERISFRRRIRVDAGCALWIVT